MDAAARVDAAEPDDPEHRLESSSSASAARISLSVSELRAAAMLSATTSRAAKEALEAGHAARAADLLAYLAKGEGGVGIEGERRRARDEPDELAGARKDCECAIATCKCFIVNVKRVRPDGRD